MLPIITTSEKTFRDIIEDQTKVLFESELAISNNLEKLNRLVFDLTSLTKKILQIQIQADEDMKRQYFEDKETADETKRSKKSNRSGGDNIGGLSPIAGAAGGSLLSSLSKLLGGGLSFGAGAFTGVAGVAAISSIKSLFKGSVIKNILSKGSVKIGLAGLAVGIFGDVFKELIAKNFTDDPEVQRNIEDTVDIGFGTISNLMIGALFGPIGWIAGALKSVKDIFDIVIDREKEKLDEYLKDPEKLAKHLTNKTNERGQGAGGAAARATVAGTEAAKDMGIISDNTDTKPIHIESLKHNLNQLSKSVKTAPDRKGISNSLAYALYYHPEDPEVVPTARTLYKETIDKLPEESKKFFDMQIKRTFRHIDKNINDDLIEKYMRSLNIDPSISFNSESITPTLISTDTITGRQGTDALSSVTPSPIEAPRVSIGQTSSVTPSPIEAPRVSIGQTSSVTPSPIEAPRVSIGQAAVEQVSLSTSDSDDNNSQTQVNGSFDYNSYKKAMAIRESGNRLDVVNKFGFAGRYQMGTMALKDAGFIKMDASNSNSAMENPDNWTGKNGISSREDFLKSEEGQEAAMKAYTNKQLGYLKNRGAINKDSSGVEIAKALAPSHLLGVGGYLGGKKKDGFGTTPQEYEQIGVKSQSQVAALTPEKTNKTPSVNVGPTINMVSPDQKQSPPSPPAIVLSPTTKRETFSEMSAMMSGFMT